MNFQIDIKPSEPGYHSHSITFYIDGQCFNVLALSSTVNDLLQAGLVKQVKGMKHDENDKLVEFEYPNGVDSAGVKYTSKVFTLIEKTNS